MLVPTAQEEWNTYVSQVDEWMTAVEEAISYRSEEKQKEKGHVATELESLKSLRGKLLEPLDDEKLKLAFTSQVDYVATAFEQWRTANREVRKEPFAGNNQAVPPGGHRLPSLPYAYDALEPYISERIMRLHHLEHHQSYVDGLNKAELAMKEARETHDFELIRHWEKEAAFHGAGHYLHTMFWENMSPQGGGEPSGKLREQINKDFGSFQAFKQHFSEAAKKVQGAGWALLVWAPRARKLEILQAEFHHLLSQQDIIPLLGLDVWEHAYYLQYENNRDEYVEQFWNIINWRNVSDRFKEARQVTWRPL
jgi:Fe-Mn family superoxide dismutase